MDELRNEIITMAAFRYALGRHSYILSHVQEHLLEEARKNSKTRNRIDSYIKEIEEEYDENPYMDESWLWVCNELKKIKSQTVN